MTSDDAYIKRTGSEWSIGSASVKRVMALEEGKFFLKSFKTGDGRDILQPGAKAGEFSVLLGDKERISGLSGGWELLDSKEKKLSQGELQLDITLRRDDLEVTKSYVVYPESSIIREWVTFKNVGSSPIKIIEPAFLEASVSPGSLKDTDFHWMTGGENQPGSWMLKTEKLSSGKPRTFDSYDPFPTDKGTPYFPGDGINAKILVNDRQVWPDKGWQYVQSANVTVPFDLTLDVLEGDKISFVVNMNGNYGWDTTAFDPTIAYADGESHTASKEFSEEQGKSGWRYQYIENGEPVDLVYYSEPNQWRKKKDNPSGTPFIGQGNQHPDAGQDSARVYTVPKSGRVRITGSVCNTGNVGGSGYGFRMGSGSYAPWYALYANDTKDGVFIGWDYFGHWTSSFTANNEGAVSVQLQVAGHKETLEPGKSVTTPKAFIGVFQDDLDNAGNECLDWQYRYMWDYTREDWFPAIRMLGYWFKGTGWGMPGVGWTGGNPDWDSTFRKVFRVADLMRYCGADVYHRDWGWWDHAGDWNSPDFRTTGKYLRKSDMGQLIYAFLYTVSPESKVAKEHPEWCIGGCLDMSQPEVVNFMLGQLDSFVNRWGAFEWRNDSTFTCPRDGDDTPLLGQDQGFRELLKRFLDKYPGCAFQAVNGGGNYGGYDYSRYASTFSFSDGAVGVLRNYYASLMLPPDKTSDIPDVWNPNNYNKADWRGLLCINFDMTGDTWDPEKLEGIRELIDIYHYLEKYGVVGRWVKVYRPEVTGDDKTMYLQRLSGDRRYGIVIPKHPAPGQVTLKLKGLLPDETYTVSFHESQETKRRTGRDLMEKGITGQFAPGELIYLNLPLHPGSKLDKENPTAPGNVTKRKGDNMGYPGVELTWKAGTDNNWVSYYEVFRNGESIDKVAKGTYYFDHSAGAAPSAAYEVWTVDGAGNTSEKIAANGPSAAAAVIFDDMSADNVHFNGEWQHQSDLLPAYNKTISLSNTKDASVELAFEGKRVLWFSKHGADCGKASVSIDGGPAETVDTYSADDIWGVCVYRKELASAGKHTIRIQVLGEHGLRAKGSFVHIDGFRVEND